MLGVLGEELLAQTVGLAARLRRTSGPSSTIRPSVMTATRSAIVRMRARLWVMKRSERRLSCAVAEQVDDGGLDRDVERGGDLVADEDVRLAGERAGDGHALALAAGQLVG